MPDNDREYEKKSVNLWVDPERKDRWQAYLDEDSEFQYLSQLIRQAVEREINQSQDEGLDAELSQEITTYLEELHGTVGQLEQVLQDVESRLSALEREVRDDPRVRQLANEVFETLPTKPAIKDYETNIADGATPPENVARRAQAGTVAGIAESLDAEPQEVKAALDRLQEDTHQVHTMEWDGQTRYYKEG